MLATHRSFAEDTEHSICKQHQSGYFQREAKRYSYALEIILPTNTTTPTQSPGTCNVTNSTDPYIVNGGFEDDLVNWTAVAYNASSSTFEIGVTDEALEGCTALSVSHAICKPQANIPPARRCRSQIASRCLTTSKRQLFSPTWNQNKTTRSTSPLDITALQPDRMLTQILSIRSACQTILLTMVPSAVLPTPPVP